MDYHRAKGSTTTSLLAEDELSAESVPMERGTKRESSPKQPTTCISKAVRVFDKSVILKALIVVVWFVFTCCFALSGTLKDKLKTTTDPPSGSDPLQADESYKQCYITPRPPSLPAVRIGKHG